MATPDTTLSAIAADHANSPRHHGRLPYHTAHARLTGPCNTTMEFWLDVHEDLIADASFITNGCKASFASGSVASSLAIGKTIDEALAIDQQILLAALDGLPKQEEHCALLAANTLSAACVDYKNSLAKRSHEESASSCETCDNKDCSALKRNPDEGDQEFAERQQIQERLCRIKHKIVVLSGKGGVGKSTVAVNLAAALALAGKEVGLLDVDIHGPSIPTMLGLEGETIQGHEGELFPAEVGNMKVMSLGFFLQSQDDAVIWRGPLKMGAIKQFIKDVAWGNLDYLIIDSPPGTGDEPLSVCQIIGELTGAVIVTTPQKVAAVDVRKSITFCHQLKVPVLGVIENMSGFVCPHCGKTTDILNSGGGARMAEEMKVPFLGAIPIDPQIVQACDDGTAFISRFAESPTAQIMHRITQPIIALDQHK